MRREGSRKDRRGDMMIEIERNGSLPSSHMDTLGTPTIPPVPAYSYSLSLIQPIGQQSNNPLDSMGIEMTCAQCHFDMPMPEWHQSVCLS